MTKTTIKVLWESFQKAHEDNHGEPSVGQTRDRRLAFYAGVSALFGLINTASVGHLTPEEEAQLWQSIHKELLDFQESLIQTATPPVGKKKRGPLR